MTGFDYILHRSNGTLVELNSQVGTFRAVTSEKLTAVRQDVSSAELTLISSEAFTVNVGDWIQAKGIRLYCMSTIDKYTCSEDNNREYQLTFYSPEYYLRLAILYNTSESESGGVYSYSRVDNTYPSVGTFEDFVKLCCYNCNSVQGERMFKVGTISEDIATDIRVITFSDYNCLAVLKQSCESFETTWKVRVNEDPEPDSVFIIDFGVAIEDFPVTLKVEHAQGLTSIDVTASDKDVFTQFVIKGGSENLPSDYPYPNLQLDEDPSSTPPILANSMIKLPDLYSRWGKSIKELTYEDIKPSRTGTVTSISGNILKFTDSDLIGAAWSPVGGTIHFVSGHLIGFTFNCKDFNSTTGEITIESTEENNGFVLPSPTDSYYRINELDKYNIAGVSLPTSYITAAKTALKERALLGIDYWSQPRMQYAITIDPKIISVEIVPNMGFHIEHSALGIDKVINVQQVVYDLSKDSPYDIESILISDLKTDDSRADATHRQIATTAHRLDDADKTSSSIKTVIKNLDTYIDGAFYDGVISKAEADAIEKYINIVNSQKSDIDAQFTALYANSYLSGDPKTNLNNAKAAIDTATTNLLNSINTAIADGSATAAEKADVDSKFTAFNSALSTYQTRVEEAKGAIEAAIEAAAKAYADTQLGNFATTVTGDISALQSQIDGNITTWFYAYVPTTANAPASDWTTTALKNQHLGDLFYDTETGYCYRYQLSGATYSWQRITDTDVTTALANAAAAQDTADSKRRVFVATPTTPYDIGDLWLYGGELYKCKVDTASGSFDWAHWEKGVKYTDDTAANAAAAAAAAAQSAADDAQDDADAANALLANIASDSKLTASEKQAAQKEWDIIQAEKTKNDTQADLYSVSKTAYTNAYNALSSYLSTLLSDLTTTSNITGSEFRGKFKDYYNARTDLLNAISNAAKAAAEATAAALDDAIQVGGRNLVLNSDTRLESNAYNIGNITLSEDMVIGETYTLTAWGELADSQRLYIGRYPSSAEFSSPFRSANGTYTATFVFSINPSYPNDVKNKLRLYNWPNSGNLAGYISKIKVEKGNKATDWTPAPEDVQAEIDAASDAVNQLESDLEYLKNGFRDGSTYVTGGLVLSEFVGVTDGATPTQNVVAGMAGKDFVLDGETPITSPMFFAGSTTAQNANNAKFRVYQDGSMYAELGEIGGLTISASKLYLGTGNHNNADTAFYVDDDGKFSLKNKLSFDGTNLTINGGGTFTGSVSIGDILIGKDAYGSGLHGIKLNAHNYWYLNGANAKFKIGGDTANVYWDGTDLTQNGVKIGGGSMVGTSIDIPNATTPLFKVTDAGVITAKSGTIGGVNFTDTKLYLGTGTYGNSNTGFYVDTSAKFSLKDKLKFDGTNLTINGGGTFSGALSAATGSFAGSLSAATGTFSGSLSAASGTFEGLLDVGGIKIGLNAISAGIDGLYINANNYWDESGNFKAGGSASYVYWNGTTFAIKGDITGSTGTFGGVFAGTITAGDAVFGVSADGAGNDGLYINSYNYWYDTGVFKVGSSTKYLHFDGTNATFTGTLSAASGTFGGTVAIGETLKIGASVNGANDGIFINTNNYWYGTGALKIGDASAYLSYNAGALTMVGGSITSGRFETPADTDGTIVSVKDNNVSGRGGFFLSNVGDGVGITLRYDYAAEEGRLVIYQSGGSSAVLTQNSLEIDDGVSASLLTTTGINVGGTIFNAATIGAGSVGKSACGFLRAASSSKQNEDSTHTHQYVNGYKIVVGTGSSTDTIYFSTT